MDPGRRPRYLRGRPPWGEGDVISTQTPDGPKGRSPERATRVSNREYPTVPGRVSFETDLIRGTGTILDVSVTGAHVYKPSEVLTRDTRVELFFLQPGTQRLLHAFSEVVRETETGFAVRFLRVERKLTSLILAATDED